MSLKRERNFDALKVKVIAALDRLSRNLTEVVPPPYKINVHTVEMESGLSVSALRYYPELKDLILAASQKNNIEVTPKKHIDNINCELSDEIKRLKNEAKEAKLNIKHIESTLHTAHIKNIEILIAIHNSLTPEQKKELYRPNILKLFKNKE